MFNEDYKAQLNLLDQQTTNLEAMLSKRETSGPEWNDIRGRVAVVRDCLRRVQELHAQAGASWSQRDIDRLEYETQAMNRRFDELLAALERRVQDVAPALPTGALN